MRRIPNEQIFHFVVTVIDKSESAPLANVAVNWYKRIFNLLQSVTHLDFVIKNHFRYLPFPFEDFIFDCFFFIDYRSFVHQTVGFRGLLSSIKWPSKSITSALRKISHTYWKINMCRNDISLLLKNLFQNANAFLIDFVPTYICNSHYLCPLKVKQLSSIMFPWATRFEVECQNLLHSFLIFPHTMFISSRNIFSLLCRDRIYSFPSSLTYLRSIMNHFPGSYFLHVCISSVVGLMHLFEQKFLWTNHSIISITRKVQCV